MREKKLLSALLLCTTIAIATAQQFNWVFQPIWDNENMQVMDKAGDGSATLVGYGNTIMRTTDSGTTWTDPGIITDADHFDFQDISIKDTIGYAVAMNSFKAINRAENDLYAACPLLKTTNAGATWSQLPIDQMGDGEPDSLNFSLPGNIQKKFMAVACIDDTVVYVAAYWKDFDGNTHTNVYKSKDGGYNWTVLLPDGGSNTITSIFEFKDHVYIAGNKTLYKVNIATDAVIDLNAVIVSQNKDASIYFWYPSAYNNELFFPTTSDSIWHTNDEGASFTTVPNVTGGYNIQKFNDSCFVVMGSTSKTKASTDTGATWVACDATESIWNATRIGDSLVALAKGDLYKMAISDIELGTFIWHKTEVPAYSTSNFKGIAVTAHGTIIAGSRDCLITSTDGYLTSTDVIKPTKKEMLYASFDLEFSGLSHGEAGAAIISSRRHKVIDNPSDKHDIYLPGFIFTTTDNWATYLVVDDTQVGAKYGAAPANNPNADGCWGQDYYTSECVNDTVFYVYVQWFDTVNTTKVTHARIFKTTDGCNTWDTVTTDLGGAYIKSIVFNGDMGYIGGSKTFLKTTDGGTTLINLYPKLEALADDNIYIQEINQVSKDTMYISTTSDGLFVTHDGGNSFALIDGITGCSGAFIIDTNSFMTVGSESKSKYTNDGGSSWLSSYPGSTIYSPGVILGDTLFGCAKSGLWKLAIADLEANNDGSGINVQEMLSEEDELIVWQSGSMLHLRSKEMMQHCRLIHLSGRLAGAYNVNNTNYTINTSAITRGVYILQVTTSNKVEARQVLIQ